MTGPAFPQDAGTPQEAAPDSSSEAVVNQANRLGLQWQLRPATVDVASPVMATYDGDSTSISMTSMVGNVSQGQRVYAITVPPSGNFICGFTGQGAMYTNRIKVTSTTGNVLFSSIPANLRRVRISWRARSNDAAAFVNMRFRVNSVATNSYSSEIDFAVGAAPSAGAESATTSGHAGDCTGAGAGAGIFGTGEISIQSWDISTTNNLGWNAWAQAMVSGNISTRSGGLFNGNGPYTSLLLFPSAGSLVVGSDFQLEGIVS